MATAKQIEANRRNAKKSTGPRTVQGKDRARWNSLRHGLAAIQPILPHEDEAAFQRIRAELVEAWQPANAQELSLVDQIAQGQWRMERSCRLETALFDAQLRAHSSEGSGDAAIAASFLNPSAEAAYRILFRYDSRAQATYYRAIDRLRQIQADRLRSIRSQQALAAATCRAKPSPSTPVGRPKFQPPQPAHPKSFNPVLASFGAGARALPRLPVAPGSTHSVDILHS